MRFNYSKITEKHYFAVIWPAYHNSPAMYCISSKQKDISNISKCILRKPMKVKFYINSSFQSNSLLLHVLNITFLNEEADTRAGGASCN